MKFIKYYLVLFLVSPISHADLLYCKDQSPRPYPNNPNWRLDEKGKAAGDFSHRQLREEAILNQKNQIPVDCKDLVEVINNLEKAAKKTKLPNQTSCERPASDMKRFLEIDKKCKDNSQVLDGNQGFGCDKLWLYKQSVERSIEKNLFECSEQQWLFEFGQKCKENPLVLDGVTRIGKGYGCLLLLQ